MPLKEYLMPGETITYEAPFFVKVGDMDYSLKVTDRRLILYRRKGMVFKKEHFIGEKLSNIDSITYDEVGLLNKTAVVTVSTPSKTLPLKQKVANMKIIYQQLQGLSH